MAQAGEENPIASIDLNVTGKCTLSCTYCWGPDHDVPDSMTTQDWQNTIDLFAAKGVNAVVFTGGEPFIRKDLGEIAAHAKNRNMRTTLSTNAMLLFRPANRHTEVLPFIDDIGIPIDGSNQVVNALMRKGGGARQYHYAFNALSFLKPHYSQLEVTVRTVVSSLNARDIKNLAEILYNCRDIYHYDLWKIYPFVATEDSYASRNASEHQLASGQFEAVVGQVKDSFPNLPTKLYNPKKRQGRYIHVYPQGDVFVTTSAIGKKNIGNIKKNHPDKIFADIKNFINLAENRRHAHTS